MRNLEKSGLLSSNNMGTLMGQIELRYLYNCENMQNQLQFRYRIDESTTTNWNFVPVVYDISSEIPTGNQISHK